MPPRPISLALAASLSLLPLFTTPATADVFLETSYLPTTSILGVSPTIVPTSYLSTSYVPTSEIIGSTSYAYPTSTTYYRRSLFRPRRYVERTYNSYSVAPTSAYLLPTSYALPTTYIGGSSLLPTTYLSTSSLYPTTYLSRSYVAPTSFLVDDGLVATSASSSSYPCETTSAPSPAKINRIEPTGNIENRNTLTSTPRSSGLGVERRPQGSVSSTPGPEEAPSSAVKQDIPPVAPSPSVKPETATPPAVPGLEGPEPEKIQLPKPGQAGGASQSPGEMSFRTTLRPNYAVRNVLRGRVVSLETRQPEEGVTVILAHATGLYNDRPAMTDADGEFKVSLPDGDWTVKVKMPSGTVYPVGRDFVTASNGRVIDVNGRNVADFLITR